MKNNSKRKKYFFVEIKSVKIIIQIYLLLDQALQYLLYPNK